MFHMQNISYVAGIAAKSRSKAFCQYDSDDMCLSFTSSKTSQFPMHDGHRARYYQFAKVIQLMEFNGIIHITISTFMAGWLAVSCPCVLSWHYVAFSPVISKNVTGFTHAKYQLCVRLGFFVVEFFNPSNFLPSHNKTLKYEGL